MNFFDKLDPDGHPNDEVFELKWLKRLKELFGYKTSSVKESRLSEKAELVVDTDDG